MLIGAWLMFSSTAWLQTAASTPIAAYYRDGDVRMGAEPLSDEAQSANDALQAFSNAVSHEATDALMCVVLQVCYPRTMSDRTVH